MPDCAPEYDRSCRNATLHPNMPKYARIWRNSHYHSRLCQKVILCEDALKHAGKCDIMPEYATLRWDTGDTGDCAKVSHNMAELPIHARV
jgi:hypothetical protein